MTRPPYDGSTDIPCDHGPPQRGKVPRALLLTGRLPHHQSASCGVPATFRRQHTLAADIHVLWYWTSLGNGSRLPGRRRGLTPKSLGGHAKWSLARLRFDIVPGKTDEIAVEVLSGTCCVVTMPLMFSTVSAARSLCLAWRAEFLQFQNCFSPITHLVSLSAIRGSSSSRLLPRRQSVARGSATHQHIRRRSGFRLHDRAGFFRGGDGFLPRPREETSERQSFAFEANDPTQVWLGRPLAQRRDQLTGGLIAVPARAETTVDDFLEMIAAGETADSFTVIERAVSPPASIAAIRPICRCRRAAAPAHFAPRDLIRHAEYVELISGDTTATELVRRDGRSPSFSSSPSQTKTLNGVRSRLQRLSAVAAEHSSAQRNGRALTSNETLGLSALRAATRSDRRATAYSQCESSAPALINFDEPIQDFERPRLAGKQLGEIGLADPARKPIGDLDAHLRRQPPLRVFGVQGKLADPPLPSSVRSGRCGRSRICTPSPDSRLWSRSGPPRNLLGDPRQSLVLLSP